MKQDHVGVVVARFQSPELHHGHRSLLNSVLDMHRDVLVILGRSEVQLSSHDPLDHETRVAMISAHYPNVRIIPLNDRRSNEEWSAALDALIAKEFPKRKVLLYGGRQSFIDAYSGTHEANVLEETPSISGTEFRNRVAESPRPTPDFRAGVIYASQKRFPISYQTVDVAVVNYDQGLVLLGKKKGDGGKLRFIGGFVDPKDESLERAAKREVIEETSHIEIDSLKYLGSFRVDDWRYKGKEDGIMTAFFAAHFIFGAPKAADDLDEVMWTPWQEITKVLVAEHQPLGATLTKHLTEQPKKEGQP